MRYQLRLPGLAIAAMLLVTACNSSTSPTTAPASAAAPSAAAPSAAAPSDSAGAPASAGADVMGVDDGTKLTLWTRAATEARVRPLVEAYNASHKNQIELTVTPTDDYQTKVGAAAGSNGLPDLFSADVVFMPNWTSQGLFQDITSQIAGLPYADKIAPGAHQGVDLGRQEVRPAVHRRPVRLAVQQGALPPGRPRSREGPPTTLEEFADQARAVAKLGNGIHGTFFGGNCGGCKVFTWWPIAWADGQQVMNPDGTQSMLNSDESKQIYSIFKTSSMTAPC